MGDVGRLCGGTLVLDVNSAPNWKMDCNKCNAIVAFAPEVHSIRVSKVSTRDATACLGTWTQLAYAPVVQAAIGWVDGGGSFRVVCRVAMFRGGASVVQRCCTLTSGSAAALWTAGKRSTPRACCATTS